MSILTNGKQADLQAMSDEELIAHRVRMAQRRRSESMSLGGVAASRAVDFANEFERIRAETLRRAGASMAKWSESDHG